ncbi:hypothetical protein HPB50_000427 [Hyalomma asiaticum]|uniref:Uncharacterized protein n=1 Tax=Hyalomma asiaticum TaxID=266040 RepID=A0ACB7RK78_HYAAI|nr:hypothetical protein HPB50_000427 [Hyalomma asiaticum]
MPNQEFKNPRYNSKLYASNDERQREMNLKVLDLFQMAFASKACDDHQFLDIGCGTGDFTRDWLLPRCQPCKRIVAVDASEDMLEYARQHCTDPRVQYDYLDIGDDVSDFAEKYGKFDRIYSFFCLNWVKDQARGMKNVSTLLTPGGECLLVFPAWSPTRMLWRKLAKLERWRKFSKAQPKEPPRPPQKKRKAAPKKSAPKNETVSVVYPPLSMTASATAVSNPLADLTSDYNQQWSQISNVLLCNSLDPTSDASRTTFGAPVPPAFYFRDIPKNDHRSEADRLVQDVWPE